MPTNDSEWQDLIIQAGKVFSPSAPIDARALFAGREPQIRTLVDAINQKGQHAIVYGERGVGKTSLTNVLRYFLGKQTFAVSTPRVQSDALDTFEKIWRRAFEKVEVKTPVTAARFSGEVEYRTTNATDMLGSEVSPDDVRRVLASLSKTALTIVTIDEFDRLPAEKRRPFADTIKTLSDHAVPATVILVGVAENVNELIAEHESIERAVVQVRMPRMSDAEIAQIIDTGVKKLGMTIAATALQRIVLLSQGLPHYAHLIGLYASRTCLEAHTLEIGDEAVRQAIDKAVERAQQSISSVWHQAVASQRKDTLFADVLLSCALAETDQQNTFGPQDVRRPMCEIVRRPHDIATFTQHLNEFCDPKRGPILQRIGSSRRYRYRFVNPLMQPFVIMQGFRTDKITPEMLERLKRPS